MLFTITHRLSSKNHKKISTVSSGIEARLLFNFWTLGTVLYLRFCQFLFYKSPNFHNFFSLLLKSLRIWQNNWNFLSCVLHYWLFLKQSFLISWISPITWCITELMLFSNGDTTYNNPIKARKFKVIEWHDTILRIFPKKKRTNYFDIFFNNNYYLNFP